MVPCSNKCILPHEQNRVPLGKECLSVVLQQILSSKICKGLEGIRKYILNISSVMLSTIVNKCL